mgnify:CR=1 FL=1
MSDEKYFFHHHKHTCTLFEKIFIGNLTYIGGPSVYFIQRKNERKKEAGIVTLAAINPEIEKTSRHFRRGHIVKPPERYLEGLRWMDRRVT